MGFMILLNEEVADRAIGKLCAWSEGNAAYVCQIADGSVDNDTQKSSLQAMCTDVDWDDVGKHVKRIFPGAIMVE